MGRAHQFRGSDWKFVATSVSPGSQQQQEIPFCPGSTGLERVHFISKGDASDPLRPSLFSHGWERAGWADAEQAAHVSAFWLALWVASEREEQPGDSPRQRAQTGGG